MLIIMHTMAALTLCGCQQQEEVVVPEPTPTPAVVPEPAYVVTDLALALPDITPATPAAGTRMSAEVVQDGSARDVTVMSITPFMTQGPIQSTDLPSLPDGWDEEMVYRPKDNGTKEFRYLETFTFLRDVASMLTYAKAEPDNSLQLPQGATSKSYYGSLITMIDGDKVETISHFDTPASLKFDLEPIYDIDKDKIPAHAKAIARYLTTIANSEVTVGEEPSVETLRWKDTDGELKGFYNGFINMGNNARPDLIAGSAANVIPFVNALYKEIADIYQNSANLTDIQKQLCAVIMKNIHDVEFVTLSEGSVSTLGENNDYPHELGLPDGAAVLVWNTDYENDPSEQHFDVVTQTTSTSNITGIGRYAYPPALYYYGNSQIQTSNEEVGTDQYNDLDTWEDVLALYDDGTKITINTKAVAIKDPLQYGMARLQARVNAVGNVLEDSNGDDIPVTAASFPITGIIISGQFPVGFDFSVIGDNTTTENEDESGDNSKEHFVFDRHVMDKDGQEIYLSNRDNTRDFNTLVLQTKTYRQEKPEESDVTVILELENKSGHDFRGENKMIVYQDTKFYLVGKLKIETPPQDGDEDYKKRVFTQDHTTEVSMTINSLARAYNVMPNILSGRLEVSVEMKLKWTEATPTTVILK